MVGTTWNSDNHKIYASIIARINILFVVVFVLVCRECIMQSNMCRRPRIGSYFRVCVGRFFVRIVVFALTDSLCDGHICACFPNYIVYCWLAVLYVSGCCCRRSVTKQ